MRASVFHAPFDVRVDDVPDASIQERTDAVVRVTHACVCGSDLWFYRGTAQWQAGYRTGHEFCGVVEEVGKDVHDLQVGDFVIAPFAFSDGTCEFCQKGLQTSCVHGGGWGGRDYDGGQAEAVRVPWADGTLVKVSPEVAGDARIMRAAAPLTDVLPTGHHAAVSAGVGPGSTAVVIGDGAVGLCGVLASHRLGAERIIAVGHHPARLEIARKFGATDVVDSTDPDAATMIKEMTSGGAASVLEAVGYQASMDLAVDVARPGGIVGFVGVPAGIEKVNIRAMFGKNVALRGGVAPARAYIPELLADVVAGRLDPSPVLDLAIPLEDIGTGYKAMHERTAIKVLIEVG
ncbi:MAG: zinc-binding dehydrogenase [Candidatus Dormibacteria bacterium]